MTFSVRLGLGKHFSFHAVRSFFAIFLCMALSWCLFQMLRTSSWYIEELLKLYIVLQNVKSRGPHHMWGCSCLSTVKDTVEQPCSKIRIRILISWFLFLAHAQWRFYSELLPGRDRPPPPKKSQKIHKSLQKQQVFLL